MSPSGERGTSAIRRFAQQSRTALNANHSKYTALNVASVSPASSISTSVSPAMA